MKPHMGWSNILLVTMLLSVGGCFSSLFTLGPPENAKTSRIYVGDWIFSGDGAPKMFIRNFDDKSYVVEIVSKNKEGKEEREFYRGFTADVKEVTFAHLKKLNDDGTLDDKWLIYRIAVTDGGQLILRGLSDEFFKDKTIKSDDDLRKLVAENIDNDAMFDKEPLTGTREPKPAG